MAGSLPFAAALVVWLGLPRSCGAEGSSERVGAVAATPLVLGLRSDAPDLDPEVVRRAIEVELGRWVVLADPTTAPPSVDHLGVEIDLGHNQLVVRYYQMGRRPLQRIVSPPPKPDALLRNLAWLAGNLVRDQTTDLLDSSPAAAVAMPTVALPPVVAVTRTETIVARSPSQPVDVYAPATAAFFFPLALHGHAPDLRTHFSFNLIYGRVGKLDRGLQLGGANAVSGPMDGLQVGFFYNTVGDNARGVQVAPVNYVAGSVTGLQFAAFTNQAVGDVDGGQLAVVNGTLGHLRGAQVGLVNSAGDVQGLQAGFINVARRVKGVQLGLVNVSDDIEGIPIGLINVSATGGIHPTVWTSATTYLTAGLKFSTRHVYSLFSGSLHEDRGLRLFGPGLAFGLRVPFKVLVVEGDVGGKFLFGGPLTGVSRREGFSDDMGLLAARALLGAELHRRFTLYAGAAYVVRTRFYQPAGDVTWDAGPDLFAGVQL